MMTPHKSRVFHITPHLGGGVGSVLRNYFASVIEDPNFDHSLCCLEPSSLSQKTQFSVLVDTVDDNCFSSIEGIKDNISKADIVVMHWWNHPLLFELMVNTSFPSCRLMFWSHVSGLGGTSIFTENLLNFPDAFYLSTPISKQANVDAKVCEKLQSCDYIWATSGLPDSNSRTSHKKNSLNVGYVGTLDYAKIHPHFISMSSRVNTENTNFTICGDINEVMLEEATTDALKGRFKFVGFVENVGDYINSFDLFGYPLTANHYGTCDQVLGEVMSYGVPPVVFDNPMESFIVSHDDSGLVVSSEDEYINALEFLLDEPSERNRLGKNAKERAAALYDTRKLISAWNTAYNKVLALPKTAKSWNKRFDRLYSPTDVFFESVGKAFNHLREIDEESVSWLRVKSDLGWQSLTKGSLHHYSKFFPYDEELKYLSETFRRNIR
tara:strand:+ start:1176 stop:2489 length:1314 start_codon:yes stop_codon:yes gene_type:complete